MGGDENVLYLDFGEGYMINNIPMFIKLCTWNWRNLFNVNCTLIKPSKKKKDNQLPYSLQDSFSHIHASLLYYTDKC